MQEHECHMNGKFNHLTMTIIQECCNHVGTTWRPGLAAIQVGKHGCHHVEIPAYSIYASTLLCIVMRHVKHVALGTEKNKKVCDFSKPVLCITTATVTLELLIVRSLNTERIVVSEQCQVLSRLQTIFSLLTGYFPAISLQHSSRRQSSLAWNCFQQWNPAALPGCAASSLAKAAQGAQCLRNRELPASMHQAACN